MATAPQPQVVLEGNQAIANLLLGGSGGTAVFQGERPLEDWSRAIAGEGASRLPWTIGLAPVGLPLRAIHHRNGRYVFLVEYPPQVRTMPWIREDSPEPYGFEATYRDVSIALPYVVFFWAVTEQGCLSQSSVFFRTEPLARRDYQDALLDCHFLNCSAAPRRTGVYCWICSQHMRSEMKSSGETPLEFVAGCTENFFFAASNLSSEHHEGNSFFGKGTKGRAAISDNRVRTVRAWEEASREDPRFVLEVPWNPSGYTVARVFDELTGAQEEIWPFRSAGDLAARIPTSNDRKRR